MESDNKVSDCSCRLMFSRSESAPSVTDSVHAATPVGTPCAVPASDRDFFRVWKTLKTAEEKVAMLLGIPPSSLQTIFKSEIR